MVNTTTINKFVNRFLEENNQSDLYEQWTSVSVQKSLKTLCNKLDSKKSKDPNAPKHAKSAYLFFCQENREAVKKTLGKEAKATEITKELGKRWGLLKAKGEKHTTKYVKMAEEDKQRYDQQKSEYVPSEEFTTKSRKRDPNAPRRAKSAYLFFCDEFRSVVSKELGPDSKATDVTRELGRRWNELKATSETATERYSELAEEDKQRYQSEKSSMSGPSTTKQPSKRKQTKSKVVEKATPTKKVTKTTESKPVQKGKQQKSSTDDANAYREFCSQRREDVKSENPNMNAKQITSLLTSMWKEMDDDAREEFMTSD